MIKTDNKTTVATDKFCKFSCASVLRLRKTFLRMCSGAPRTQPGLPWSNYFHKHTRIRAALSNNAGQKSWRLKRSLLSTSTNIRGLKQWVIMKGDWWKGPFMCNKLGASHTWTQEEGKLKELQACVHVCVPVFRGTLGSAAVLVNPCKTSTHFLWWCWADLALLRPFSVCVLLTIQVSNSFIKLPKERKRCPCSDFPLPVIYCTAFHLRSEPLVFVNLWMCRHSTHQPEFTVGKVYWSKVWIINKAERSKFLGGQGRWTRFRREKKPLHLSVSCYRALWSLSLLA